MRLDRLIVPFALKAITTGTDTTAPTVEGYGSVFDVLDSYSDIVAKGAFKRTLKEAKQKGIAPAMLWQHDVRMPIGVWTDLREDDKGLVVTGRLAKTQLACDVHALLQMDPPAVSGLSIGFRTLKSKMDDETGVRTLTEIELWEVSLVTFPANDAARVTAVKADGELPTEREFERWLRREAGFTEEHAKTIIAKGYRHVRREAGSADAAAVAELIAALNQRTAIFTGEQVS